MKELKTSDITNSAQMPIKKGTLAFLQQAHIENMEDLLLALLGATGFSLAPIVLYGCVNSGSGSTYNISAGAVLFLGRICRVDSASFTLGGGQSAIYSLVTTQYTTDADPVTFTDGVSRNVHNINKIAISAGTGGALFSSFVYYNWKTEQAFATETVRGILELATQGETDAGADDARAITALKLKSTSEAIGSDSGKLRTKVVNIGDWNMDSTIQINVAHGLTLLKIRAVKVIIINDASNNMKDLYLFSSTTGAMLGGTIDGMDGTNITISRLTGGDFDNNAYDSTGFNRGYVYIEYAL
jgi:hypothetical protein